jgi:hypothetical protein
MALFRHAGIVSVVCALSLIAPSQRLFAGALADSGISETAPVQSVPAPSLPSVKEDTLFPSTMEPRRGDAGETMKKTSSGESPKEFSTVRGAIARGKGLTSTGMFIHFFGLGLSTIQTIVSLTTKNGGDATASTVVGVLSECFMVTGPIFSCAGSSIVTEEAKKSGDGGTEPFSPWKDYGLGWTYTGVGAGMGFIGVIIAASSTGNSDNSGAAIIAIPLVISGAVFAIMGEVQWIKSLVHARINVCRFEDRYGKPSISWSISPLITRNNGTGIALNARF